MHPATDSLGNIIYGPGNIQPENPRSSYTATSGPLQMSQDQYNSLAANIAAQVAAPPNYSAIAVPGGVQCSMWAVNALQDINLIPQVLSPHITPELIPILDALIWNPLAQSVGFGLNNLLTQIDAGIRASTGGTYRVVYYSYDPLVLDLDGDGIETVASNGLAGALFDQNGDGIRTATGWVKSDDGILVRDINGNGTIDNGSEVFGDSTALAAGGTAADGFAALSGIDSNGDGVVNSADANFSQLQIWRDLNQNGVSDAGELFTLQQSGIQSLNTAAANATPIAVAGGILAETGSYMRTDGTVSTMGDVSGRVAAQQRGTHRRTPCGCNLAADTFQRSFTNVIPTTPQTAALHDMQGGGAGNDVYLFECSSGQGAIIHAANETMFEVRTVG